MYGISVAADLVGMGVQNLRLYEAAACSNPNAPTGHRRYSATTWIGSAGSGTCSTPVSTWPASAWSWTWRERTPSCVKNRRLQHGSQCRRRTRHRDPGPDQLEQEQQAAPRLGRHQKWPVDTAQDVDEADRLEQAHKWLGDPDEEYPPDPP